MAAGLWITAVITRKRENKHERQRYCRESLLAANTGNSNLSGEERRWAPTQQKEMLHAHKTQEFFFRELFTNLPALVKLQTSLINILPHANKVLSPCEMTQGDHVSSAQKGLGVGFYCEATSASNKIPFIKPFCCLIQVDNDVSFFSH